MIRTKFEGYDPAGVRLYHKGGGGGSSTTTQSIPTELKPLATAYTNKAMDLGGQGYQAYGGQRYADLNSTQNQALGMVQQRATGGDQTIGAGNAYLQGQLQAGPSGATANPYGDVSALRNGSTITPGINRSVIDAGANSSRVSAGANAYAGSNPYLDASIDKAQQDVVRNFNLTTKPQWDTAMQQSGSFGNSGVAEMASNAQRDLAGQLAGISTNMRMQDYTAQQGLAESALARDMQAQQFNSGVTDSNLARSLQAQLLNSGIAESNLARDMAGQQYNSQLEGANLDREMQAQQFNATQGQDWASRNDAALQNQRSSNLSAAQLGLQYGNQAYTDAQQLLSAGQTQQDQVQQGLDYGYQQYQDAQNLPYKQLAAMSGVFGSNLGATSTTTQNSGGK